MTIKNKGTLETPEGGEGIVDTQSVPEPVDLPTHRSSSTRISRLAKAPRDKEKNALSDETEAEESRLQEALDALSHLGAEEHRALADMGYTVPVVSSGTTVHDAKKIRLGYQCRACHQPGLYFVGDKFMDPDGEMQDLPPLTVHVSRIPWSQPHLDSHSVNRSSPHCQFCHSELRLTGDGRLQQRLVINIEQWISQRREAWKQMEAIRTPNADPAGTRDKAPMPRSLYDIMEPQYVKALERISEHVNLGELAFGKGP